MVPPICHRRRSCCHLEFRAEVFHAAGAFDTVAVSAEQLQVREMMGAAFGDSDDVVYFEMLRGEMRTASCAVAALFAVEVLAVRGAVVGGYPAEVCALGDVGAVDDVAEQSLTVLDAFHD